LISYGVPHTQRTAHQAPTNYSHSRTFANSSGDGVDELSTSVGRRRFTSRSEGIPSRFMDVCALLSIAILSKERYVVKHFFVKATSVYRQNMDFILRKMRPSGQRPLHQYAILYLFLL